MSLIGGIDIETTGLEQAEGHRIIEVAALLYDEDTQALKAKWVQRINPQRPISAGAQAVHHISFESLAAEPIWEAVAPKMQKIFKLCTKWVAHNGAGKEIHAVTVDQAAVLQHHEAFGVGRIAEA